MPAMRLRGSSPAKAAEVVNGAINAVRRNMLVNFLEILFLVMVLSFLFELIEGNILLPEENWSKRNGQKKTSQNEATSMDFTMLTGRLLRSK